LISNFDIFLKHILLGEDLDIILFIDRGVAEIFINNGEASGVLRYLPNPKLTLISFTQETDKKDNDIDYAIFPSNSSWTNDNIQLESLELKN